MVSLIEFFSNKFHFMLIYFFRPRNKRQDPAEKNVVQEEPDCPMDMDTDLRGSNVSINSISSSISTMSQDQPPMMMSDDSQNGYALILHNLRVIFKVSFFFSGILRPCPRIRMVKPLQIPTLDPLRAKELLP